MGIDEAFRVMGCVFTLAILFALFGAFVAGALLI